MRSAIFPLIIINVIMYLLQNAVEGFTETFVLISAIVLSEPWRLVTSMFLHGSQVHIFLNMFVLFIFGPILEQRIGTKRFLQIYFISGLVAGILAVLFYEAALGASGAIMGIVGATIYLLPNLRVLLFFIIPMPLWFAGIIIAGIDFLGMLNIISLGSGNIAHAAHLGGMAAGFILALYLKGKSKKIRMNNFESKTHLTADEIDEYMSNGRI